MNPANGERRGRQPLRSKKAHVAPPPREIKPKSKPGADEKEIGQFTGPGNSGLEKK